MMCAARFTPHPRGRVSGHRSAADRDFLAPLRSPASRVRRRRLDAFMLRPGALFLVGDPKQAIYRFRGADIAAYAAARDDEKAELDRERVRLW